MRKHAGMIVPLPVQQAMTAALGDDEHVAVQKGRYARRRAVLRAAVEAAGLRVDHSVAGLYLWATADEPAGRPWVGWPSWASWSHRAPSTAPGGGSHVRIALTATDERIDAAAARLQQAPCATETASRSAEAACAAPGGSVAERVAETPRHPRLAAPSGVRVASEVPLALRHAPSD